MVVICCVPGVLVLFRALADLKDSAVESMQKELTHKKAMREQDRIIRELLNAKKHLRDEVKAVLKTAEAEQVEAQFKEYHKRRDAQLAELTVRS